MTGWTPEELASATYVQPMIDAEAAEATFRLVPR